MVRSSQDLSTDRRGGLLLGVLFLHLIVAICLASFRPEVRFPQSPLLSAMDLILAPPPLPAQSQGVASADQGGAPAAASRVHRPSVPPPDKVELMSPQVLAPLQELVVGLAPVSEAQGLGQGGIGDGLGAGTGSGSGQGRGVGPELIHGPAGATMTANVEMAALAQLPGPYAVLHCYVQSGDPRLRNCRVTREHPAQSGAGEAARLLSAEFRYRPPARIGRTPRRERQIVAISFPASTTFPVDR